MNTLKKDPRNLLPRHERRLQIPPEIFFPLYLKNGKDREATQREIIQILSDHLAGLLNPEYYQDWHSSRSLYSSFPTVPTEQPQTQEKTRGLPTNWLI